MDECDDDSVKGASDPQGRRSVLCERGGRQRGYGSLLGGIYMASNYGTMLQDLMSTSSQPSSANTGLPLDKHLQARLPRPARLHQPSPHSSYPYQPKRRTAAPPSPATSPLSYRPAASGCIRFSTHPCARGGFGTVASRERQRGRQRREERRNSNTGAEEDEYHHDMFWRVRESV